MHVLVTGATGFIGRHLVPALLDLGLEVTATSRSEDAARAMEWFPAVRFLALDLAQSGPGLFARLGRPDRCLHLAWDGLSNYRDPGHVERTLPLHQAFLDRLLDEGLGHLLVTGTCLEYGLRQGRLDETMGPGPDNPYAMAKDRLRRFLETRAAHCNAVLQWVRLFYMYGPGQNPRSLLAQLDRAIDEGREAFDMSGGEQSRDYLPVQTVARNLARIALQRAVSGIINCCSGQPITVKELVLEHLRKRGASLRLNLGVYPYPDWEPMHFWGNTAKLEQALAAYNIQEPH